jgi:hypothetical protein
MGVIRIGLQEVLFQHHLSSCLVIEIAVSVRQETCLDHSVVS